MLPPPPPSYRHRAEPISRHAACQIVKNYNLWLRFRRTWRGQPAAQGAAKSILYWIDQPTGRQVAIRAAGWRFGERMHFADVRWGGWL